MSASKQTRPDRTPPNVGQVDLFLSGERDGEYGRCGDTPLRRTFLRITEASNKSAIFLLFLLHLLRIPLLPILQEVPECRRIRKIFRFSKHLQQCRWDKSQTWDQKAILDYHNHQSKNIIIRAETVSIEDTTATSDGFASSIISHFDDFAVIIVVVFAQFVISLPGQLLTRQFWCRMCICLPRSE